MKLLDHVPAFMPEVLPTKLAFVGEAPSQTDRETGVPFTGSDGRVFNAMMRAANLDRDAYLITNTFDEQPPEDDKERTVWMKDQGRIDANFARLSEELDKARPNVIVPLGGTALWAFTGETGISHYRGAVSKARRIAEGTKLIPTFHPAIIQKTWHFLVTGVKDLEKAAIEGEYPDVRYPKVQILVEPTFADIVAFAEECKASPKLSIDIETGWGQITSVGFAPSRQRAMCIPLIDLRKPNKSYWPTAEREAEVWGVIRDICAAPNPKVGQNFMYDAFWLFKRKGIRVNNYRSDTRLRHKVLFPELPADLASMAATYTDVGAWKMWGGRYQKNETKKDG